MRPDLSDQERDAQGTTEQSAKVSPETVEAYFGEYGWSFETLGPGVWRTGFRGTSSFHTIYMRLTEDWLYMTISPFVEAPTQVECKRRTYEAMLHFNREMNLAKFVLDEDEDVTLTVELPLTAMGYTVFAEGLTALAYYADDAYLEMNQLSRDPKMLSRFQTLGGGSAKTILA
jgi:hypothetical protein